MLGYFTKRTENVKLSQNKKADFQLMESRRISRELKAKGRWLALSELQYKSHDGTVRSWECAERVSCAGAVAVIATLKPSGRIVLTRQYRPPVDANVVEFPAGLVNKGEDPAETATRELREETGYLGRVVKMLPPAYNSPGLTGECVWLAIVEVEEDGHGELKTEFDESESIETLAVPLAGLPGFLEQAEKGGDKIDAKVSAFAVALGLKP